ncbi:MAG TPA: translation initiation factor IF-2 N-terminal domain-containing protein, partial [Candidatus Acidoferrales bacterium]|nr:translation initiation factor IF-2 N-terminal domain-containing protein [Candidatus Acidoferrales bacterium]
MNEPNQIRINELARELEVKAKIIIDYLPEAGVTEKKTHSSSIDLAAAEKVRKHFRDLADREAAKEAAAAAEKAAKEAAAKAARMKPPAPPTPVAAPVGAPAKPAAAPAALRPAGAGLPAAKPAVPATPTPP